MIDVAEVRKSLYYTTKYLEEQIEVLNYAVESEMFKTLSKRSKEGFENDIKRYKKELERFSELYWSENLSLKEESE